MKIDTTIIAGYEAMSAEEKVAALEALEYDDNSEKLKKYKKYIDDYTSEIAKLKKAAKAREDEDASSKAESDKELVALRDELKALKAESTISKYVANYLEQGYEKDLAQKKAKALVEGDFDTVFECEAKYKEALEKKFSADSVKNTPKPEDKGKASGPKKTKEEIMNIKDAEERQRMIAENIELFERK